MPLTRHLTDGRYNSLRPFALYIIIQGKGRFFMHVRYLNIGNMTSESERAALEMMSPEKRARVLRMANAPARMRSCAGELLARDMLSQISGIRAEDITITVNAQGKPQAPGTGLEFSVSHSGNWVVCITAAVPVGIDTELPRPFNAHVAQRVCGPSELSYISKDPQPRFLRIWTLKEAYGKMTGSGIFINRVIFGDECHNAEFSAFGARFYTLSGPDKNTTSICLLDNSALPNGRT